MQANSVVCRAFLMDLSTDITDIAQLVGFVLGIHSAFEVHEGVASLRRLKDLVFKLSPCCENRILSSFG
jgi:ligand-binding sensor protein